MGQSYIEVKGKWTIIAEPSKIRRKSRQITEHELPAVVGRLVLADRSVADQVSEQHNRAGALVHQKTD